MLRSPKQGSNRFLPNKFLLISPIGFFVGTIDSGCLLSLEWTSQQPDSFDGHETDLAGYIQNSLSQYFQTKVTNWDFTFHLPGTAEEQRVYIELLKVPYGTTMTYSELAERVKKPKAIRWVAHVCAKNTLPIVIPCHRIVRKDQTGQYSAGGTKAKKWLIAHELSLVSAKCKPPF